jgi:hypothetical protein
MSALRGQAAAPHLKSPAPGLSVCSLIESPLARSALRISSLFVYQLRPIPVRRNFRAWDCKITPAYGACQEGNTICCTHSNDGLGAGMEAFFPHELREDDPMAAPSFAGGKNGGNR